MVVDDLAHAVLLRKVADLFDAFEDAAVAVEDRDVELGTTGAGDDDVGLLLLAMAVSERHVGSWLVGALTPISADCMASRANFQLIGTSCGLRSESSSKFVFVQSGMGLVWPG
ncbi:MAG: hypothetical protein WKF48_12825 [Solirubrobacteraceae bacterium]